MEFTDPFNREFDDAIVLVVPVGSSSPKPYRIRDLAALGISAETIDALVRDMEANCQTY